MAETLAPEPTSPSRLTSWARLVRLPNVFTVVADVGAAYLLVSQGPDPVPRLVCVVMAGISLYWAGMILNDVFDVDHDRLQRPSRPIPAGDIPLPQAKRAGWSLLATGIAWAALSGRWPSQQVPATWLPAAVAAVLALMIIAYDGPLKRTALAAPAMGSCRMLSFLLGAAPCLPMAADGPWLPRYIVGIAIGMGVYVTGLTTMARRETSGGASPHLPGGLAVTMLGAAILAFAPQLARNPAPWHASPTQTFPILIGMISLPVILRGLRALGDPTPAKIQITIQVGILTIIPLAASFAFLGAGPVWGMAVFMLSIPAMLLSMRFRVT